MTDPDFEVNATGTLKALDEKDMEIQRLKAAINKAGGLALQKASHEFIRQVLAEALEDHSCPEGAEK